MWYRQKSQLSTVHWGGNHLASILVSKKHIISICDLRSSYKKFLGEKASPAWLNLYAVIITEGTEWSRDGLQCGQAGECLQGIIKHKVWKTDSMGQN